MCLLGNSVKLHCSRQGLTVELSFVDRSQSLRLIVSRNVNPQGPNPILLACTRISTASHMIKLRTTEFEEYPD